MRRAITHLKFPSSTPILIRCAIDGTTLCESHLESLTSAHPENPDPDAGSASRSIVRCDADVTAHAVGQQPTAAPPSCRHPNGEFADVLFCTSTGTLGGLKRRCDDQGL